MAEGVDMSGLEEAFKKQCKIDDIKKAKITTAQVNKWFKGNGMYGAKLTSNSVDIMFMKCKKEKGKGAKKELGFDEFKDLLKEATKDYKTDKKMKEDGAAIQDMVKKLESGIDVKKGTTKTSATGGVERQTDTKLYTGAHKERFDDSGKGKGAAGRKDEANTTGYVGNYKGEGTFDKK